MAKYVCNTACYHDDRIFKIGQEYEGPSAPKHFDILVPVQEMVAVPQVVEPEKDPATFSELQVIEEAAAEKAAVNKMAKDDLIAKATEKGYSEKYDLVSFVVKELKELILDGVIPSRLISLTDVVQ